MTFHSTNGECSASLFPNLAPHNIQSLDDFEAIENLNYHVDFKESHNPGVTTSY